MRTDDRFFRWLDGIRLLLFIQNHVNAFLIQAVPGACRGIDDDRNESSQDVQNNPSRSNVVRNRLDLRLIAFFPKLDGAGLF